MPELPAIQEELNESGGSSMIIYHNEYGFSNRISDSIALQEQEEAKIQ